jgi:hypothetical protein
MQVVLSIPMGILAVLAAGILSGSPMAQGQAMPTATRESSLSVFAGATGVYTGIEGGKNLGITAGADYSFWHFAGFRMAAEVRGTYPIDEGHIDGQKSILAGVRIERSLGRLHPYGDFLIGRGGIDYINPPVIQISPTAGITYIQTNSTVYSPGAGLEYDLTHHFAARVDAQLQHWDTPLNTSGTAWAKQGTLAVTYRFDFNHHWNQHRSH